MVKKRSRLYLVSFWTTVTAVFLVTSAVLVLGATGYTINWQRLKLQQTGMIMLKGNENNVEVKMNGRLIGTQLPVKVSSLAEGWYDVTISRANYNTWEKNFWIEPGQATNEQNIILWKNEGKPEIVTDTKIISQVKAIILPPDIVVDSNEIIVGDNLVTRFSQSPISYNWYKNQAYILFQIGREIRVIKIDGTDDTTLVQLENDGPSNFMADSNGNYLIYSDGSLVKKVQIH